MATAETTRRKPRATRPGVGPLASAREQPFNAEAEVGVLGSLFLMPELADDLIGELKPEDFFDPAHQTLCRQIFAMHGAGEKIDPTLIHERLRSAGELELVGGTAGLARIITAVPVPAHAKYYSGIVREKSLLRQIIQVCNEISVRAFEPGEAAGDLLNAAEEKVFGIREKRHTAQLQILEETLHQAVERLEARARGESLTGTVESGFKDLDGLTGGMHASELVIIAARPSMGKTAFALNIAENVVLQSQRPVLFASLEMAAIELTERLLCSVAKVNGSRLRSGTLAREDQRKLVGVAGQIASAPLFIDDSHSQTIAEIAAAARRVKRTRNDLAMVIVDYLQLIEPDNMSDSRQEQVARIARRLKGLAKELKVPVVCLAQLNRQAEDTRDHRPRLSHLRESGAIEQDADVVMFVHRADYYRNADDESEDNRGKATIIVAKQRNGPIDDIELVWRQEYTRFEDRAPERFGEFDQYPPGSFQT